MKFLNYLLVKTQIQSTLVTHHCTVAVHLPPHCTVNLSPPFIFTVLWLLNLWFIFLVVSPLAVVVSTPVFTTVFFFTTLNPYELIISMVHAKWESLWLIQIDNLYESYELSICQTYLNWQSIWVIQVGRVYTDCQPVWYIRIIRRCKKLTSFDVATTTPTIMTITNSI